MSTLEGFSDNAFIEKPASGWLHGDNDLIDGNSITYTIQYVGVVPVLESINNWKQETRTELIREAIVRLADHAEIIQVNKKRKIPSKVKKALAAPNAQWRCECRLSISIDGFAIKNAVNKRELCKHPLNGVSFASGGEGPTLDFVAYVGKEPRTGRGCHIFECPRKAHLVLLTMGQAFDLAARRYKGRKGLPLTVPNDSWAPSGPGPSPSDYEAPTAVRGMNRSGEGVYDNGIGSRGEGLYDNRSPQPADYEAVTSSTPADYETARASRKGKGMFDDDIYDTLKNDMAHSRDGVYDNLPAGHDGAAGKGRPQKKKGSGEEEDIYGGLGEGGEGIYDNASRGQAMRYSEDGLYDNPHSMGQDGVYDNVAAGKGRPQKKKGSGEEEDIYGGLGEGGEGIYDNASRGQAMRYSEDGLYDNPHGMGQDGVYDNVAAKGRPQKKKGGGMDEDIYGSLGEGAEGLYDDTRGGKGMRYSEDGLYDNPHSMGQDGVYDNVAAAKGRPQKKKGGGMDEDIYGSLGEGGEGLYDDTRGGKGMRYSEDGLYDNPHGGKGESGLYDNPARQKQRERAQRAGEDEDIYGGVGDGEEGVYDTVGGGRTMRLSEDGIYDNPHAKGENSTYDNPGMRRTPHAAVKGKGDMDPEEDIYGGFGEREEGIYDLTTGGGRGMKHSEEGIYDNPHAKGEEGVYDNPAMKRRPQAAVKAGSSNGPEEDIYGITGEGQGAEGIYDNPKVVGKGGKMDFSDTGIYDNPHAATAQAGEEGVYEGIPDDFIEKKNTGPEEDIYGGAGDVVGGDGIYDNPHVVTGGSAPGSKDEGMAYSGDGIYDNPEAVMQDDPLYDNKEGVMTKPEERPGHFRRQPEFDHSIYAHNPRTTMKGLQGPKERWPLIHQSWFHGKVERIEAEALLENDGDFLVRESKKKEGQYVLTALVGKQPQHLVLVDPQGKVKAKDHEFSSVAELVYHFMDKKVPLFIGKMEVFLKQPIENVFPRASMDDDFGESIYQTTDQ